MTDALHINTRADLAAVVPHLLGFTPEDSLVCVPTNSGGPTARIDLPHDPHALTDVVEALADAYRRHRVECPAVAILAFTDQPQDALIAIQGLSTALDRTTRVDVTLIVDQDQWTDLRTGEVGEVDHGTRDRISAEFVGRGRALPRASRADIAKALEGNGAALDAIVPELLARTASMRADDLADEAGWVLHTIDQFQRHAVPLGDQPAARLVAALTLPPVRDLVLAEHSRDNAETMSSLWRDLTRRTPRAQLGPVAELLAFSSWLAGNGAEAWVALDLIEQAPARPLAGLVSAALQVAAPPQMWDKARPASQASRARSTFTSVGPSLREHLPSEHKCRADLASSNAQRQRSEPERQATAHSHSRVTSSPQRSSPRCLAECPAPTIRTDVVAIDGIST